MEKTHCPSFATAMMRGSEMAPDLRGSVRFVNTPRGTLVTAHIRGLPPNDTGFYGFHVHAEGCCDPPDFACAKGHYNPGDTAHPLHAGDMPMLLATDKMEAYLSFLTTRFSVRDVIGRSVIIHMNRDDYTSQPSGDAGPRIGCGIIGTY